MKPAEARHELDKSVGLGFSTCSFDFADTRSVLQQEPDSISGEITFSQESDPLSSWSNQVLVVINTRLGIHGVSKEYFRAIKNYMKCSTFAGLVGGKPGAAYYFVGHLEEPAEDFQPTTHPYSKGSEALTDTVEEE